MSDAEQPEIDILIVDDDEDQRRILSLYFEKAGCRVTAAARADEAIAAFRSTPPLLAVIDLVLPGMDGWQLAAQLRAEVPECAIAITSVLEEADFPHYDAVLPKPVTGSQVRQVLLDHVPLWRER
ncbi:MAG: response regulator [Microbacteriaceae bacterium]